MGSSDDLEDFDAELEMSVKREYTTVYPLFRYCIITEDATYLCNRLSVECAPNPGYLLFEIRMEDVWVWDRNRPTRIIPRAQVYTTSDITVEQLKDEDDGAEFMASLPESVVEQLKETMRQYEIDMAEAGEMETEVAEAPAPSAGTGSSGTRDRTAAPDGSEPPEGEPAPGKR